MNGALVVDKPAGLSSHDVVAIARRATRVRRIGHTGTLDPMATGVLVLVLGRATRLAQFLTAHDKTYEATIRLGLATDTYDITGTPTHSSDEIPELDTARIQQALDAFRGAFDQLPPPYSAKQVEGVRAYRLARRHQTVALRRVRVAVHELELLGHDPRQVRLRLTCSAGFYVRSLAHELGEQLGVGGCLEALRRTRTGAFSLDDAMSVEWLIGAGCDSSQRLVPMEQLVGDLTSVTLTESGARRAAHGNFLSTEHLIDRLAVAIPEQSMVRLLDPAGSLVGLARRGPEPDVLRPAVVLV